MKNNRLNPRRRDFLGLVGSATAASLLTAHAPGWAAAVSQRAAAAADRVLILIELKGGNDGLNTVVPFADPGYAALRGSLALKPDELLRLDGQAGLHGELEALMPLWEREELAIVQGVGYPHPNLSHFRSIEIWESASSASETLESGWVTRAMRAGYGAMPPVNGTAPPRDALGGVSRFTAEGVLIGTNAFGSLAGARAVSLSNPDAFVSQSRLASAMALTGNAALQHVLRVENHISQAAAGLGSDRFDFSTMFPTGGFGNAVRAAAQVVASQRASVGTGRGGVPVITLSLGSFDTHQNQLANHGALLRQLAQGVAALKSALTELGAWDRTLVMTFSEFGRRARPNNSNGTDHGTAAPHFVAGGAVRGGLYGQAPDLARLDNLQNLIHTTDFRQLYSTIARDWWGVGAFDVVRGSFEPLPFVRA